MIDKEKQPGQERPFDGSALDPLASARPDSPYVVVEALTPDTRFADAHRLMLRLQRRGLRAEERAAFRELRDLTTRLLWDLQTLGTTPTVSRDRWLGLSSLLRQGNRDEAYRQWLTEVENPDTGTAPLHVCAVLSGNELAYQTRSGKPAHDDVLRRYVALWAALLKRRKWLERFAFDRCRTWGRAAPDRGDLTQFFDRAEEAIVGNLLSGTGHVEPRRSDWSSSWTRERTCIDAVEKAFGPKPNALWAQGFGPLGLEILGRQTEARTWVRQKARSYRGGIPLSALKEGEARVDPRQEALTAEAATALALLFSGLGEAASDVWNGRGRAALAWLASRQADPPQDPSQGIDPWFGQGQGASVRFQRALEDLKAESLLFQFQEELTREEVAVGPICETLDRLLYLADFARRPNVLVERVEDLVVGRLTACSESKRLPQPAEVERIVEIAREARAMLVHRRGGERCASSLARLLKRRAVRRWNRWGDRLPRGNVQHNVLRDVLEAAALAPHHADLIADLGRVVVQMSVGSEAERRTRLETALRYADECKAAGSTSQELEEARLDILDQLDPELAIAEARRQLREAKDASEDGSEEDLK